MTTKEQFLARVSDRLRDGIPENPIRPIHPVSNDPIAYTIDTSDPLELFRGTATALGTEVVETDQTGVADLIRVTAAGGRVALTQEEAWANLQLEGIDIAPDLDPTTLSDCAVGVSNVRAAIALTGSIVIDSTVPGARVVSLLPKAHLAVVRRDQIVPTPGDVIRQLGESGAPLPSNLVFITGPSRSADIELQLTIGVHGPSRLVIALI